MTEVLFEGILVAALVGLVINQITDLISIVKVDIFQSIKVKAWITTLIIIILMIIILACLIGKYFIGKLKEIYNEIHK
jgi:hypothetical protein